MEKTWKQWWESPASRDENGTHTKLETWLADNLIDYCGYDAIVRERTRIWTKLGAVKPDLIVEVFRDEPWSSPDQNGCSSRGLNCRRAFAFEVDGTQHDECLDDVRACVLLNTCDWDGVPIVEAVFHIPNRIVGVSGVDLMSWLARTEPALFAPYHAKRLASRRYVNEDLIELCLSRGMLRRIDPLYGVMGSGWRSFVGVNNAVHHAAFSQIRDRKKALLFASRWHDKSDESLGPAFRWSGVAIRSYVNGRNCGTLSKAAEREGQKLTCVIALDE